MEITFKSDDILSISEAVRELGITRITLYRWMEKGKIASVMFGGYRAIPRSEVERLKAERQ